jgi:hypothetical protein
VHILFLDPCFIDMSSHSLKGHGWYDMVWYMIWFDMVRYDTVRYDMIWHLIYDMVHDTMWCDMIYLTAIRRTPGGSSKVHIYIQKIHKTTQLQKTIHRTTQFTNWKECEPCPVFAIYPLAFTLKLRKKHRKTSVGGGGGEDCQLARWKQSIHNNKNI